MMAWSVGWQELSILVSCFAVIPFIAGLVMLIVGLSTGKRGLWIAGLLVMLAPLALVLLGAAIIMVAGFA